jgi:energy-coupling factor transporter ATP-binding protein EcfA2
MIETLSVQNFRALRNVRIGLEPLTVLVGPNASGKSSVLDAIRRLTLVGEKNLLQIFGTDEEQHALRTRGSTGPIGLELEGKWHGVSGTAKLSLQVDRPPPIATIESAWGAESKSRSLDALNNALGWELPDLDRVLARTELLRLDARRLAEPSYSDAPPRVAPDGSGLAAVLTDVAVTWPEIWSAIQTSLRAVIPAVERVRLVRTPVKRVEWETVTIDHDRIARPVTREYAGHRIVFDMIGAADVPASLASDGTMILLGLFTILLGPGSPTIVLLDDIDRALHPKAQSELLKQLRTLLTARPDLQIVATSHSPYLLDELRFEEVRLTTLREDGSVACAPLSLHPEYPRWKDHMRPGEFWSMVAEEWIQKIATSDAHG